MVVSWWLVGSLFIFLLFGSSLFSVQTCTYVSRKVILCPFSVQAGLLPTGNWWRLDTHADLQRTCKQVEISPRMPRPRWTRGRQVVRRRRTRARPSRLGGTPRPTDEWGRRSRGTRDPTGGWGRRRSRGDRPTGAVDDGAEEDYFTRRRSRPLAAPSPDAIKQRSQKQKPTAMPWACCFPLCM